MSAAFCLAGWIVTSAVGAFEAYRDLPAPGHNPAALRTTSDNELDAP
jgi:hypothetical protein